MSLCNYKSKQVRKAENTCAEVTVAFLLPHWPRLKHVSNTTTKRWYNQIDEGPQGNFARKVIGVYY